MTKNAYTNRDRLRIMTNAFTTAAAEDWLTILQEDSSQLLYCRSCKQAVTRCGELMAVGLTAHYRFTNPAGITFPISCYRHAPGCAISGTPTIEDSWFGGYKWQIALCSECQEQLGWYYQNPKQRFFFGLIQSRLIEAQS